MRARAKNRNSAFAGTTLLAIIASKRAADEAARKAAVEAVFKELPQERFGASTVTFQVFQNAEQLTARAAQAKQQLLSLETASSVLYLEQVLPEVIEHRPAFLAAIETVTKLHAKAPKLKKYPFVQANPASFGKPSEVVIGVWDVGTNPALFQKQLFVNPAEQANGKDDDGNGLVDDVSGIASDPDSAQSALLYAPDAKLLEEYKPFLKGIMDLRAGLTTTPDAKKVLALFGSASSAEAVENLETNLSAVGEWAHGTHVAGIMLQGLPKAKLAIFRSAWAGEARVYHHRGPTDAELDAERTNMFAICDFAKAHNVRVVNASLGFASDYVQNELAYEQGTYKTEDAARARAEAVQAKRRANWKATFDRCPETLFVVAAGNSNRDVLEYADTPADLSAPNLLVVGAVDEYGKWAMFTNSAPDHVRVFDHGVSVESLIPSGEKVPLSGTSMASPNVANAAAKVLTVNPTLTPVEVIEVLTSTADPIAAPFNGAIVNEKAALKAAKAAAKPATKQPAVAAP
ncbi:MAG: S8 family serine peptidase [Polyangiales bacterium]